MRRNLRTLGLAAACACAALVGAGCGSSGGSSSSSGGTKALVTVGTTDVVASLDPAKGYGSGDVALMNSIFQTLLWTPPGASKPEPRVAESCKFDDPKTYTCTIKSGLKFSNGQPLTAQDVKFSIDRVVKIDDSAGGAYLFEPLKSTDAPDDQTVIFHLKRPTATWPQVIAGVYGGIVPKGVFPPDKLLDSSKVIGSGPYKLTKFESGRNAVLTPNPNYTGEKPKNAGITVLYYQQPSAMRLAFEKGDLDVAIAWRSLTATDLKSLDGKQGINVVSLPGLDARYLAFNVDLAPGQQLAVRKAVAYTVDRESIAKNVYDGGVKPLYSIAPQGVPGATKPFEDVYGSAPDVAKAKQVLQAAGISTPVPVTLWYTPSHYGTTSSDEWTEISRQLDSSGLFKAQLKSTEWQQYLDATGGKGSYPAYQAGWYPDYADADNFLSGLLNGGWITNYKNAKMKALLEREQGSTNEGAREKAFAEIQQLAADEAPVIPLYQADYTLAAHDGIDGLRESVNNLFLLNFDLWSKR
jgi:peptide/nickel transport system substrate-binding protein